MTGSRDPGQGERHDIVSALEIGRFARESLLVTQITLPTPARSVSNTYPVPGLEPPLWPGGQNIVHEIRGVFELLNSHEFKIQLFCHFLSPRSATVGPGVRQG